MGGFRSMQPGFASRMAAFVLAGLLAIELQADLARWLEGPEPELPVAGAQDAATRTDRATPVAARPTPEPEPVAARVAPPVAERARDREPHDTAAAATIETVAKIPDRLDPEPSPDFSIDTGPSDASPEDLLHRSAGPPDLETIRALLLAEREQEARELAREARMSDPSDLELDAAIRELGLLKPRIVELDPSVRTDDRLILSGTVRNEDIAAVRKVKVRAEAIDGDGNVVATSTTRVKPKRIEASFDGEFVVRFARRVDASRIQRTRATVVAYQYEVESGH